jgi:Protein of unknown function (DUF3833)
MKLNFHRYFLLLCVTLLFAGCASAPKPADYMQDTPVLDLKNYFAGTVDGWGYVKDRSDKVVRRFTVEIICTWNGIDGTLDERFIWSDGVKETRIWKIRKDGNRYVGTAGDVVGEAIGVASGNALQWNYVLKLPASQGSYEVNMDDWMWLIDDKTLANQTVMTKFGIKFAEINIFFRKRG